MCGLAGVGWQVSCLWLLLPQFGDGFNLDGAFSRCERENSQGCEQWAAVVYPKCRPGFHNVGCCVCSPDWCVHSRGDALLHASPPQTGMCTWRT